MQQSPEAQRSNSLPRGEPPGPQPHLVPGPPIDDEAEMDGTYRAGPLGCLHTKCQSTEAQLQRAPWPPSVVAQETFP